MAKADQNLSLPEPRLKVGDHELHMSYGMFNDIMRLIGGNEDVTYLLLNDAMTRDLVIRRLFTDNQKAIKSEEDLIDAFELPIGPAEMAPILGWVSDHACHFLLSTGKELQTTLEKYKAPSKDEDENKTSSPQSQNGTKDLAE